jgi:ATP-dependent DNA helicase RecG
MRPAILNPLFAEVTSLKGVGATLVKQLARLDISRVVDLLRHLPVMAIERLAVETVDLSMVGRQVSVTLTPVRHEPGQGRRPLRVQATDAGGQWVELVFFGQTGHWARAKLPLHDPRRITGKLDRYGQSLRIAHPEIGAVEGGPGPPLREPVYPLTEGLTNRRMTQLTAAALERAPELTEWIEPSVLARTGWPEWRTALARAHALEDEGPAKDRLAYDELLANQLALLIVRRDTRRRRGRPLAGDGRLTGALLKNLPWSPTGAQRRVAAEIAGDMAQDAPMLRLLQGDVGSGKTLVALLAMLTAVEAGAQAAMLAPTEILARQHLQTLIRMAEGLDIRIAGLTGRDKGKVRADLLDDLAMGRIDILVGTHAIFQDGVDYHDLGLVVIDEQHRFGVAERLALAAKAKHPPHLLAMTATPIPRTLQLTAYGEMDVSKLDERPPGRQEIETRVTPVDRLEDVIEGLGRHLAGGGQAYWVCPLVEGQEDGDEAAAEQRAAFLKARFGAAVGLVHGRMKPADKDAVMAEFAANRLGLLVATTVIEVGVDVPNATLMIVEAAERFGLAQLHQLRGRVGRGAARSVCLLLRGPELSETARARLKLLRETNDGFRIAEEDLRLRGAGEILGTRQSGEAVFHFADPERTSRLIGMARDDATLLLDRDGGLDGERGQAARVLLYLFEQDAGVARLRSG